MHRLSKGRKKLYFINFYVGVCLCIRTIMMGQAKNNLCNKMVHKNTKWMSCAIENKRIWYQATTFEFLLFINCQSLLLNYLYDCKVLCMIKDSTLGFPFNCVILRCAMVFGKSIFLGGTNGMHYLYAIRIHVITHVANNVLCHEDF